MFYAHFTQFSVPHTHHLFIISWCYWDDLGVSVSATSASPAQADNLGVHTRLSTDSSQWTPLGTGQFAGSWRYSVDGGRADFTLAYPAVVTTNVPFSLISRQPALVFTAVIEAAAALCPRQAWRKSRHLPVHHPPPRLPPSPPPPAPTSTHEPYWSCTGSDGSGKWGVAAASLVTW